MPSSWLVVFSKGTFTLRVSSFCGREGPIAMKIRIEKDIQRSSAQHPSVTWRQAWNMYVV
jgi:hypothetical protein